MQRRHALVALSALSTAPLVSRGQAYPSKALKIVVPFAAGGTADLTARTVGQKLSTQLGQPVVIDNKPGAGGVVAADTVARAEPDGHTLLLMSNGTAVSASLFKSLPYDTLRDFTPVSTLGSFDLALVASADAPWANLGELLAQAKGRKDPLNVGTVAVGSTQNLAAELFKTSTGLNLQVVPYNGTPALITALRGKQVDVGVEILGPVRGQIQGGALKALAVMGDKRAPGLPDVGTVQEAGVARFAVSSWNAIAVPAKTPTAVVARLERELAQALQSPEVRSRLAELHVEARASTASQAKELLVAEIKRWGEVIETARIPRQ